MRIVGRLAVLFTVAILSSAAAAEPSGCGGKTVSPGAIDVHVGSLKRVFLLRLPAGYDSAAPRPVVMSFHGFTMNAHLMESLADFASAWPEAIVVYPQGMARMFPGIDVGPQPGWQMSAGEFDDRDLAFFDSMVRWLRDNLCVEDRVYVTGYSNGAYFVNLLGCERPSALAGIAAASGGIRCAPKVAAPVILTHGIDDPLVSYDEGIRTAAAWAGANHCARPPGTGAAGCAGAESCEAPLVLCTTKGGHEYENEFTRRAVEFLKTSRPARKPIERR